MVSRKLAMRHEPDIGLRCCSTCSKITCFSFEKHEADDNPLPHPCTPCVHFETFPCLPAARAHVFQHVRVMQVHTGTFWTDTPHTPHRITRHNTTQHNMTHTTPHHNNTTTTPHGERRQDKTKRGRQDKTRRRERREERRDKR